jgi:hypothetical protein
MALVPINLATQSNPARFKAEGSARLINAVAEDTGDDAKAAWTVYAPAGLDIWNTVTASGTGGVKALLETDDYLYVVAGRNVSAIDLFGVVTLVTTLPSDGPAFLARNRRSPTPEVCLVSDGLGYIITGTSIATITDPDLPPPISVSALDGYFLFPTTFDRVFISNEDNGSVITATDFGKAQKAPDNTLYVLGGERDAMIFGETTVEWWSDSPDGTGNFPFVPVASINLGCMGAKTVVQLDRVVAWVANDGTVRIQDGYSARRISGYAQERMIGAVADKTTILGFGWNEPSTGHAFLCWTCDDWTIVYDIGTARWHERKSHGRVNWRGACSARWQGMTLIGDYTDGRLYSINERVATEGGEPILMEVMTPIIHMAPYGFVINGVFVDVMAGVGEGVLSEDADPHLMLSTSIDGGKTFGPERRIALGSRGQRLKRVKDYRFGMFGPGGCTLRLAISASVDRAISGIAIDAEKLVA